MGIARCDGGHDRAIHNAQPIQAVPDWGQELVWCRVCAVLLGCAVLFGGRVLGFQSHRSWQKYVTSSWPVKCTR